MSWLPAGPPRADHPFGTTGLIVAEPSDDADALADAIDQPPIWMPIGLVGIPGSGAMLAQAVADTRPLADPGRVVLLERNHLPAPTEVLELINTRPPPSPAELRSRLLGDRMPGGNPLVFESLFEPTLLVPERTYRHHLRRWLGCTHAALRRFQTLVQLRRLQSSVDALASEAGTTPTRLRQWVRSLLGVPLVIYNRCPGWEWVVRAAKDRGIITSGPRDGRASKLRVDERVARRLAMRRAQWASRREAGKRGSGEAGKRGAR